MPVLDAIDRLVGALCRGVLYLTLAVVFTILAANVVLRYVAGTSLAILAGLKVPHGRPYRPGPEESRRWEANRERHRRIAAGGSLRTEDRGRGRRHEDTSQDYAPA